MMSLRQYAKRRGVSAMSVSLAVKAGRLSASVVRDEHGQPKISDPALADQEWDRNTDSQKRVNAAGGVDPAVLRIDDTDRLAPFRAEPRAGVVEPQGDSVATATERLKSAQADLAELKFAEAAGELVPAKDVETRLVNVFAACKTRLLAIPSRARQAAPDLTAAQLELIEKLIREACEDLTEARE